MAISTKTVTVVTCDSPACGLPIKDGCGMAVVSLGGRDDESPTNQKEWRGGGFPKQYHENCMIRLLVDGKWGHVNEYGN